jgi:hypothetical protein
VKLSNISRSLHEEQRLIKRGGRLHRNLDSGDFSKVLNEEIYRLGASKALDDTVNALDPSDIRKGHARRMECLRRIHNGSEQELISLPKTGFVTYSLPEPISDHRLISVEITESNTQYKGGVSTY